MVLESKRGKFSSWNLKIKVHFMNRIHKPGAYLSHVLILILKR